MAKKNSTPRGDTIGIAEADTDFGRELIASAKEALAHKRGEIALPSRVVEEMPAVRVKEIRKKVATSTKDFEAKYGVPARTVEGWEQGKKLDVTGRLLLRMIESKPKDIAKIAASVMNQRKANERTVIATPMGQIKRDARTGQIRILKSRSTRKKSPHVRNGKTSQVQA